MIHKLIFTLFTCSSLILTNFISVSYSAEKKLKPNSIFNLDSTWTSHRNKTMKLKKFLGSQTLIAMVYTSCQHTCPLITSKINSIVKKIKDKRVNVVLITFDPKRDTPEKLYKYSKKMKLGKNWYLLTGLEADIRSIAAVLGVNYKEDSEGEFSHSNIITLLDADGVIKYQVKGLNEDIDSLIKKAIL